MMGEKQVNDLVTYQQRQAYTAKIDTYYRLGVKACMS